MLGRKELFKNTLRKTAYAWKRIIELRLTGEFFVVRIWFTFLLSSFYTRIIVDSLSLLIFYFYRGGSK